ncbi:MAG TPA: hypothetical protein VJB14_09095, partial [Planctomycetota bacterium]|nr:hypothetical protein [Planctomycetota bacterium]
EAIEALKADPAYPDAKSRAFYWELYYKGLKEEIEGRFPAARGRYKTILSNKPGDELRARTEARLKTVEAKLAELHLKPASR